MRINFLHGLGGAVTIGAIAFGAVPAAQGFTLDAFTDSQSLVAPNVFGPQVASSQVSGSGVAVGGGFRDAILTVPPLGFGPGDFLNTVVIAGQGRLTLNNGSEFLSNNSASTYTLIYDGSNPNASAAGIPDVDGLCSGGSCLDLTGFSDIRITALDADLSGEYTVAFTLFDSVGNDSTSSFVGDLFSLTSSGPSDVVVALSSFSGVDLSNVGAIKVDFSSPNAADYQFGAINLTPVPEPLTILGTGVALGLGSLFERRRKSQA